MGERTFFHHPNAIENNYSVTVYRKYGEGRNMVFISPLKVEVSPFSYGYGGKCRKSVKLPPPCMDVNKASGPEAEAPETQSFRH